MKPASDAPDPTPGVAITDIFQRTLETLYDVRAPVRVRPFLLHDAQRVRNVDPDGRPNVEKLLIRQRDGALDLGLFVAPEPLAELARNNPFERLTDRNLAAFCVVLEGVSHFTYTACNAALDKQVTLLELELQAEVDKFVVASLLLRRQVSRPQHRALMKRLFGRAQFCGGLSRAELERYAEASRAAGRFCERVLRPGRRARQRLADLRRFYRMPKLDKLAAC